MHGASHEHPRTSTLTRAPSHEHPCTGPHTNTLTRAPLHKHPHINTLTRAPSHKHPHTSTLARAPSHEHPCTGPHTSTLTRAPSHKHPRTSTLAQAPSPKHPGMPYPSSYLFAPTLTPTHGCPGTPRRRSCGVPPPPNLAEPQEPVDVLGEEDHVPRLAQHHHEAAQRLQVAPIHLLRRRRPGA